MGKRAGWWSGEAHCARVLGFICSLVAAIGGGEVAEPFSTNIIASYDVERKKAQLRVSSIPRAL